MNFMQAWLADNHSTVILSVLYGKTLGLEGFVWNPVKRRSHHTDNDTDTNNDTDTITGGEINPL